jgi:hypothetical protein
MFGQSGVSVCYRVARAAAALACATALLFAVRPARAQTASSQEKEPAPIAVHDYEVDGVAVELLSVQRTSGDTLTLKWRYRNKSSEPKKLGESFTGMGWSEPYSLVYDAYVVDAANKTKYPVLKDTSGHLIAGKHAGRKVVVLKAKETLSTWAKFPAPPPATKKVTVFIPGVEPFEDVTIQAAAE